ncbi:hypothetical protein [Dactylosporangium sp. NPDC050588]|uniref:hypothetical protein n=1 Tax=Dactylosporangium sp. NPDC050588 TaxID=3157211 RepID=UPI0033EE374D
MPSCQQLVEEALAAPVAGWDFTWLRGRSHGGDPSWSYQALARPPIAGASSLLDVDTGGELLASLAPLPPRTVATESWAPNVPVAAATLLFDPSEEVPLRAAGIVDLASWKHPRTLDVILRAAHDPSLVDAGGDVSRVLALLPYDVPADDLPELVRWGFDLQRTTDGANP